MVRSLSHWESAMTNRAMQVTLAQDIAPSAGRRPRVRESARRPGSDCAGRVLPARPDRALPGRRTSPLSRIAGTAVDVGRLRGARSLQRRDGGEFTTSVSLPPASILAATRKRATAEQARFVTEQYIGRYTPASGWSLTLAAVGQRHGDRTCAVVAKDIDDKTEVALRAVLGGCGLQAGIVLQVVGRILAVDHRITLEAVRFWKKDRHKHAPRDR